MCEPLKRLEGRQAATYVYLLASYLGDGTIIRMRNGVFKLSIACAEDHPFIMQEMSGAIRSLLPVKATSYKNRMDVRCFILMAYSKHWPCLFPQHGRGRKHLRPIRLEPWQQRMVDAHPDQLIRGLIHTDGCRTTNLVKGRRYEYTRYFFVNESTDIIALFTRSLDRLGVEWRMNRPNSVSIARRASVARLDEFVGPKR